ncbi:ATP-dependent DNA helicase RecG [Muriicola sp.]|uniref:ATP-dependent DNA helicase RecG n=2 Tax=Muriicola sp. TaxID=2020856 RepID=UPI003562AEE3
MKTDLLQTPITYLKGVGPNRAQALQSELGITTYNDLLHFFPNRYIDKTRYYKISELERNSSEVQLIGKIVHIKTVEQKRGSRLVARFVDDTGEMELVWFRGHKWIREQLQLNVPYVIFGRTNWFNGLFSMPHPEMELLTAHEQGMRIHMQPIYPSTEKLSNKGITNRVMSNMVQQLFTETGGVYRETLSKDLLDDLKLVSRSEALFNIHFPKDQKKLAKAQFRLKLEELFFIQLQLIAKKLLRKKKIKGLPFEHVGEHFNTFYRDFLPFELTGAQQKVIKEIRADLGSNAQMNRLLQGDVGSGKTIVALMSMLLAMDNGYQSCLMAPTEILANQHYNSLKEVLGDMKVNMALLTGSVRKSDRKGIHEALEDGSLHILVGTHAVLEHKVRFKNLGLAIIDEQHRFGVAQRSKLWKKNDIPPHILVMTATPIPRTLAMSLYGDLDISVIDELPPGRKPVKTVHRYDSNRLKVFRFLKDEIKKGRQVYVVYPLIQESQALDYKDLMDGYESISREFPLPDYRISIVHGQMKSEDKDYEMSRFVKGETQIMVATTVIEVGVNVPNATVMIIESAERFGLSQLHQLRGRVGRGGEQSYCILLTGQKLSADARTRIETMTSTQDGFEIAEVDLKLRGPGDLMGTQQSGLLNLKIADIVRDNEILKTARFYALRILQEDPDLVLEKNAPIRQTYAELLRHKNIWNYIS